MWNPSIFTNSEIPVFFLHSCLSSVGYRPVPATLLHQALQVSKSELLAVSQMVLQIVPRHKLGRL